MSAAVKTVTAVTLRADTNGGYLSVPPRYATQEHRLFTSSAVWNTALNLFIHSITADAPTFIDQQRGL